MMLDILIILLFCYSVWYLLWLFAPYVPLSLTCKKNSKCHLNMYCNVSCGLIVMSWSNHCILNQRTSRVDLSGDVGKVVNDIRDVTAATEEQN